MNNSDMERKIKTAFTNAAPDVLSSVLSDCDIKQNERIYINMTDKKKNNWVKPLVGIAAAVAILVGGVFGARALFFGPKVETIISLDVNPSVEISIDKDEKILAVNALNEDAIVIIDDMDFKGSSLDVAVNALIGSMLRHGYIDDIANSILISVDGADQAKSAELSKRLAADIEGIINSQTNGGAVISQVVASESEIEAIANEYGITKGKAQLIVQLASQNPLYTIDSLARLSINEIKLLIESNDAKVNAESTGIASDKAYIGADAAKAAALADAGFSAEAVRRLRASLDFENGRMVYEVEFYRGTTEYDFDVDALTGEIVKREVDDNEHVTPGEPAGNLIGEEAAKAAALASCGVSQADIDRYSCYLDYDDGMAVYEIEFHVGHYEYNIDVNAATGAIVDFDKDYEMSDEDDDDDDDRYNNQGQNGNQGQSSGSYIGENAAKNAAYARAGVSASSVRRCVCELDNDNGRMVYEIEFYVGSYEYDVEIDAYTGAVREYSRELDD